MDFAGFCVGKGFEVGLGRVFLEKLLRVGGVGLSKQCSLRVDWKSVSKAKRDLSAAVLEKVSR